MQKIILSLLAAGLIIAAYIFFTRSASQPTQAEPLPASQESSLPTNLPTAGDQNTTNTFTLDQITAHSTADDCWLAIDGQVYDVTDFIASHPGGKAILQGCGQDATQLFETRPMGSQTPHSPKARDLLPNYLIGTLAD